MFCVEDAQHSTMRTKTERPIKFFFFACLLPITKIILVIHYFLVDYYLLLVYACFLLDRFSNNLEVNILKVTKREHNKNK